MTLCILKSFRGLITGAIQLAPDPYLMSNKQLSTTCRCSPLLVSPSVFKSGPVWHYYSIVEDFRVFLEDCRAGNCLIPCAWHPQDMMKRARLDKKKKKKSKDGYSIHVGAIRFYLSRDPKRSGYLIRLFHISYPVHLLGTACSVLTKVVHLTNIQLIYWGVRQFSGYKDKCTC